jgi:hypothetical protein
MALTVPIPNISAVPEPRTEEEALDSMRVLLESGRGKEAQRAAARWTKQFPDSAKLAKWDDVLNFQHSEWRKGGTYHDHSADFDWIRDNAAKFPGNWMAIRDGALVAVDPKLAEVRRKVRELGVDAEGVLLWGEPKPQAK